MIHFKHLLILTRRTAPVFGLFAACCCAAWAQPDGPMGPPPDGPPPADMQQSHGPSVDKEVKQLTALLTLTADQQTQVKAILTDQKQQIETLFKPPAKSTSGKASDDDQLPSREAMEAIRTSIKTIREDTRTKIAALLTADQQTKFAAWAKKQAKSQSQQDDDMPPPPPDGDGGPPDGGGGPPGGGGPGGGGPPGI